jgi:hypothetical protein
MAVSPDRYQRGFDERLQHFLPRAAGSVPALRARLREAGMGLGEKT